MNPLRDDIATPTCAGVRRWVPVGARIGPDTEVDMGTSKKENEEVRKDPPGPVDHGRDGGMATRENAPEVVERSDDEKK